MSTKRSVQPTENETLQSYLREISRFPRLTPEEERELGRRIKEHRDVEALRGLVEGNLRFVVSYAKRYRGLGAPFLDLIHEGNLGLIEAARRFDPGFGVKFITYAVWWIRQALVHVLSSQTRALSLPPKLSTVAAKLGRQVTELSAELDRTPTTAEIADDLDISPSDAEALLRLYGDDVSLSQPVGRMEGGEARELSDVMAQQVVEPVESGLIREALGAQVRSALAELDPREREVMELRFGLGDQEPQTLQEIGERLNLSRERIRQIEARAKEKLRRSHKARELRSYLN